MKEKEEHKRKWACIANTVKCIIALAVGILVIIFKVVVPIVAPQCESTTTIDYIAFGVCALLGVVVVAYALVRIFKGVCKTKGPFLVDCLETVFKALEYLSISTLLCPKPKEETKEKNEIPLSEEDKNKKKNEHDFCIEVYVLIRLVFSVVIFWLILPSLASPGCPGLSCTGKVAVLLWASLGIFEIVVKQVNVLLFDARRKAKCAEKKGGKERWEAGGYRRMIILLMLNYVETILLFAIIYWVCSSHFNDELGNWVSASRFEVLNTSFVTMTTFGQSTWHPTDRVGKWIILIQSVIGVFMALIVLAWSISLIPKPVSRDKYERHEIPCDCKDKSEGKS